MVVFILSSFLETFGIGLLGPFFAAVSDTDTLKEKLSYIWLLRNLVTTSDGKIIIYFCLFIAVVFLLKSVLYFFSKFYVSKFAYTTQSELIETLNSTYLDSEYSYFITKNSAAMTKNVIIETQQFCYLVLLPVLDGVSNLLLLTALIFLLFKTNVVLCLAILATFLPVFIIIFFLRNKIRRWGRTTSISKQHIIKTLNHGLGGFKEVRVIGCESYFKQTMHAYASQYANATTLSASVNTLPRILLETILVILIVLFVGISEIFSTGTSSSFISTLSVFAVASIRILPAASQLVGLFSNLQKARYSVDMLYQDLKGIRQNQTIHSKSEQLRSEGERNQVIPKLITIEPESRISSPTYGFSELSAQIRLLNLTYSYPHSDRPSVSNLSLTINKGESIALIGESGSGKTTLVDIILGLLIPQKGDIQIMGKSIYNDLRSWQNCIGYIPQSIFLLDDTVKRNIAFGVPDDLIDIDRLREAVVLAQLEELVESLPEGMNNNVGERGVRISGGQRQRIGIARALYHQREVLVLDEATSALDNETERKVAKAIQSLAGEKTLITIAHRLSTVEKCDKVYRLSRGELVESGSFQEVVTSYD